MGHGAPAVQGTAGAGRAAETRRDRTPEPPMTTDRPPGPEADDLLDLRDTRAAVSWALALAVACVLTGLGLRPEHLQVPPVEAAAASAPR